MLKKRKAPHSMLLHLTRFALTAVRNASGQEVEDALHGILSMRGLAKSRNTQARIMARVKRTQYARRADLRITSLLAMLQAWQAHVAAQLARAVPVCTKGNLVSVPGMRVWA